MNKNYCEIFWISKKTQNSKIKNFMKNSHFWFKLFLRFSPKIQPKKPRITNLV